MKLKLRKNGTTSVGKRGDSNDRTISGYNLFTGSIDCRTERFLVLISAGISGVFSSLLCMGAGLMSLLHNGPFVFVSHCVTTQ